jgi:hypothetical protein
MYLEEDFIAITKFLKLGIRIHFKNPMGQNPIFQTSFPNPKGGTITLEEKSLFAIERKLRSLIGNEDPVKTKLAPFVYLGTNFNGVIFCRKGTFEFVVQETKNVFGMESNAIIRTGESLLDLLS